MSVAQHDSKPHLKQMHIFQVSLYFPFSELTFIPGGFDSHLVWPLIQMNEQKSVDYRCIPNCLSQRSATTEL